MKTRKPVRFGKVGFFFVLLFGLPFLAVGVGATWKTFDLLNDYSRAKRWIETPAFISSLELSTKHGSKSATTYRVLCRYHYTWQGRSYESDRVGLMDGSDNIGDWHKRVHARLANASRREKPVSCFVNPQNPSDAVLDRELRFPMLAFITLFATVFGTVGGAIVTGCVLAWRSESATAALTAAHPGEPWLHRSDWTSAILTPRLGSKEAVAWCCAIFWIAVSGPLLIFLPHEVFVRRNYFALFSLLFTAVDVAILVSAIRWTAQRRKFGRSSLELATVPGVIGGHLRGTLILAGQFDGLDRVNLELNCTHTYTTGSGNNRQTHNEVIWSGAVKREVAARFGQTSIELPVDFEIPHECRPTQSDQTSDQITWKLTATAEVPGVDLRLEFVVPVFRIRTID